MLKTSSPLSDYGRGDETTPKPTNSKNLRKEHIYAEKYDNNKYP